MSNFRLDSSPSRPYPAVRLWNVSLAHRDRWIQAFETPTFVKRITKTTNLYATQSPPWWVHRNICSPRWKDVNCCGSPCRQTRQQGYRSRSSSGTCRDDVGVGRKKKLAEECERMDRPPSKRPNGWTRLNPLARIRRCSSPFKDRQWLESSPRVPVKGVMIMIMMMM